jgi:SAM-dependent methyltransferase
MTSAMTWEDAVRWLLAQPDKADLARAAYFGEPLVVAQQYLASAEFAELRKVIPSTPGRALDLGAGNGILSYALAKIGWQVTAVEPDASDLVGAGAIRSLAAEPGLSITVIEAFGEAIPLDAAGFDLVIARQVLHHAHDLAAFCKEMARLGRPGAMIVTLRDHVISDETQLQDFLKAHPLHHLYGGENAFTLEQYRQGLQGAGIVIENELKSFQSVFNFDPMTKSDVRQRLSEKFGPMKPLALLLLNLVPFDIIGRVAAQLDQRPGRLVSFIGRIV